MSKVSVNTGGRLEQADIAARIQAKFGARVLEHYAFRGQHALTIAPKDLREVLGWLRDEAELAFNVLMDVGGVDYLTWAESAEDDDEADALEKAHRFEVVYQMFSTTKFHRIRIKVAVKDDSVEVPSVWDMWRSANWMEREVWDMYGVRFSGHPHLIRILNHQDFEGHPLRKDYPINKRQRLSRPIDWLLTEKQEWA
ncbi:MAG: NADH-quinone oxidoreductase subunit C [Alphaproteobacteria bacterium]|nr:NADH-quinone oxidoreductase subunit C [Alphaproteobacteria bacterium]MCB9796368.1 NADH-quinone oxidoreductase subunit C [Alphaproteobacteria bacterium]